MNTIEERGAVSADAFHNEILPRAMPVVLRGQTADWEVVALGRRSPQALADYLLALDDGGPHVIISAGPEVKGRFFLNEALDGLNYQFGEARLKAGLDYVLAHGARENPPALAIQGVDAPTRMPGFAPANPMPLLDPKVTPRLWIGSASAVAIHHDFSENLACVAAGRRRFTLFPPDQIANLYLGPMELRPAGVPISLVDPEAPDLDRFPRFAEALQHALTAELAPGDALYIPYLWWHHVRALDPLNLLVNYWWSVPTASHIHPSKAYLAALLSIKDLPEHQRAAWAAIFDQNVFQRNGPPMDHVPPDRRGALGHRIGPEEARRLEARVFSPKID